MKSFNLRWSFLTSTGSLPFEYLVFFLVGTVPRAWRFGRYARPGRKGKPGTRPQDFVLPDFGCSRKLREANDIGERFEFNRWGCFLEARIVNFCSMTWSSSKHVELKRFFPPQKKTTEGCLAVVPCDSLEHPFLEILVAEGPNTWDHLRFFLLAVFLAHFLAATTFVHQHRTLNPWWRLPRFIAILLTSTAAWTLGRTRSSGKRQFRIQHRWTYPNYSN